MELKKERVKEVDIAKGIGIILVVVGHSIPDANNGINNIYGQAIFSYIYSFHMALFMAMAGFLFWNKVKGINKNVKFADEIKKRAVRLMIPYCFYSFLIYFAKIIFSTLSRKPVGWNTLIDIIFGNSPCGNTWFLWTLFVISLIILCVAVFTRGG